MNHIRPLWNRLLPAVTATPAASDVLARGRAGLVIATCLGLVGAIAALLLAWVITGDLEGVTVAASVVVVALLAGLGALARRPGRSALAVWLLASLLVVLVALSTAPYGVASSGSAAHLLPIVLAACGLGLEAGLAVAGVSVTLVWLVAVAEVAGWYEPLLPIDISHLTFDAPTLTVVFLLAALIAGAWSRYLGRALVK
ncbi:MAG: hypothetical protein KKA73_15900 [Chloroflexi bacterium]|nr:hypothetical protein [Chloroflexota bacterium]MBU1749168.1 hypothetical protein [Chloroflexota bacterium]MBU1877832.1 hypothetical protein [Chloroflexota bacterium]